MCTRHITLSVRCHTATDCSNLQVHKDFIDNWCKYRDFIIKHSTFGIHTDSSKPHYHYHMVIMHDRSRPASLLSNPLATLKYDKTKKFFPFDESYNYIHDRNMSIKMKFHIDGSVNTIKRYLQYPLKESETHPPFYTYNAGDIKMLSLNASAEWNAIKIKRLKDKEKADKEKQRKFNLIEYLDKNAKAPFFPYDIYCLGLSFYQTDSNSPIISNICREVEEWMYHRGHLSNEDIIKQYRPKCDIKTAVFAQESIQNSFKS